MQHILHYAAVLAAITWFDWHCLTVPALLLLLLLLLFLQACLSAQEGHQLSGG
jgi:hypothetical protein